MASHLDVYVILTSVGLPISFVLIWGSIRRQLYLKYDKGQNTKTRKIESIQANFDLEAFQSARAVINGAHARAKHKQNHFQIVMALAVGGLFTAFVLFSAEISFQVSSSSFSKAVYTCEVLLMLSSFLALIYSRKLRREWVKRRVVAELIRRWFFFNTLLKNSALDTQGPLDQTKIRYLEYLKKLSSLKETEYNQLIQSDLDNLIENGQIMSGNLKENREKIRFYFEARVARQASWFLNASKRIEAFLHAREKLLVYAFFTTLGFASIKAVYYWIGLPFDFSLIKPALTFFALLAIGITVTSAAFLLNQGSNALQARYTEQQKELEHVVKQMEGTLRNPIQSIKYFEKIMNNELLFFVHSMRSSGIEVAL